MYSLHLTCAPEDVDRLSGELWEARTEGLQEIDVGDSVRLIAGFSDESRASELLARFVGYRPEWEAQPETDWVAYTQDWWAPREIGSRIFLAPVWFEGPTPLTRVRVVHNPGMASGTGEHPCTQLALQAIEDYIRPRSRVLDVGTGSGILAITAQHLGAGFVCGFDTDANALTTARENFRLNGLTPGLIAGSTECLRGAWADLVVANISGTVLLALFDELLRVLRPSGRLILSGFTEGELDTFRQLLPGAEVTALNEWRCVSGQISSLVPVP